MASMLRRQFVRVGIVVAFAIGMLALAGRPRAQQCGEWLAGAGVAGVLGVVHASLVWDPDGAGPQLPRLVVGGAFRTPAVDNLAAWDPVSGEWQALGGSVSGAVRALAVTPGGDLVAGGSFDAVDGVLASCVAIWNGSTWSPLGSGIRGSVMWLGVHALLVTANGDVYAGGRFDQAGGGPVANIARWNGGSWSAVGAGLAGMQVAALAADASGRVIAGGWFTLPGSSANECVAAWDGTSWSAVGPSLVAAGNLGVLTIAVRGNELLVGGAWSYTGSFPLGTIARWNGSTWAPLAPPVDDAVLSLNVLPNGDVLAGGAFRLAGGVSATGLARWNGIAWSTVGAPLRPAALPVVRVNTTTLLPNSEIVAAGDFGGAGAVAAHAVARFDGSTWSSFGSEMGVVAAMVTLPNGDIVAGGTFDAAGGVPAANIARWDGTNWSPLGGGIGGSVSALVVMPNGDVVAGGGFGKAGGAPAANIARWDGAAWRPLGGGVDNWVTSLAALPNGGLVAGGWFARAGGGPANAVARWDGLAWHALGDGIGGHPSFVTAVCALQNGEVLVGSRFSRAGNVPAASIARWDGAAWHALGSGVGGQPLFMPDVQVIRQLASGDVFVGWSAMGGPGHVLTALQLPDGDVVVGLMSAGAGLRRWSGTSWNSMGPADGAVCALALRPNGDLLAGGAFTTMDWKLSAFFARRVSTCPANALPLGAGCSGAGGANVLVASTRPWLGSVARSEATGMPAAGVAFIVRGVGATLSPLPQLAPTAPAGCMLLTLPELLDVQIPVAGRVQLALAIPDAAALVGAQLREQVVAAEVTAGAITALTSTNALVLTIGAL
jgi:hypothetical protein